MTDEFAQYWVVLDEIEIVSDESLEDEFRDYFYEERLEIEG